MECPVCNDSELGDGASSCPKCQSELSGFNELTAAERERAKHKRYIMGLGIVALLLGISWIASTSMKNDTASMAMSNDEKNSQVIEEQKQLITSLQGQVTELTTQNMELAEHIQTFEVVEMSEDGESIESDYHIHVVKEGESLWSIAEEYHADGFKHDEIAGHNDLNDPHYIKVGDTVIVKK
ncbi:MAG: hypothetical protein CL840_02415 [Crocinitomicaceae bacterium]|nr:hypothetical protein [Crocinitomicaceae bacterium]|tara:strand:+ start:2348 stop:2893 length:546 start_codon:yes stop_codon:yes gene_type:complete